MRYGAKAMAAVLLLGAGLTAWGADWFRSSASGVPGAPLAGTGPEPDGWSLSIERDGGGESRYLYRDGALQGSTVFLRSDGLLIAREERDPSGNVLSRVEYAYDAEGNPRAVFIAASGDTESGSSLPRVDAEYAAAADAPARRRVGGAAGDWRIVEVDASLNPVKQTDLSGGAVSEEVAWSRNDEGILREEVRSRGNDITRSLFDDEGRLLKETIRRNDAVVLVRSYTWDGSDLTRVEERGEGRLVVREMEWSDGRMTAELRLIDGVTVSDTRWPSAGEKVETLYRDGEAVIRVYWSGELKVREEFLKAGEIVRVRESDR